MASSSGRSGALADEPRGLDEHAARAAGGVEDAALVGLEHLDQQPDDVGGGVELAAAVAL
jgi:hypothetical protein